MSYRQVVGSVICALLLAGDVRVAAQTATPSLSRARDLYLAADYDAALAALGEVRAGSPDYLEGATYRVFCLLALGRTPDATREIEAIVATDPFYLPPESMASPRIREVFRTTRRAALPSIASRDYDRAKAAFNRRETASTAMFEGVLRLLADPDFDSPLARDLRVLAEGFRDLSREFAAPAAAAAAAPASPGAPPASAAPAAPAGAAAGQPVRAAATGEPAPSAAAARQGVPSAGAPPGDTPAREGDPGVVPPVALDQPMPRWIPPSRSTDRQQTFQGVLEVLIDAKGAVTSAVVREGIHPQFDAELVKLARSWRFRPATRGGTPTPYLKVVLVRLNPSLR